jgi:hypothetical protein
MAGFVQLHEKGGRTLFIDAGRVVGVSCPGHAETTASPDEPIDVMISGEAPRQIVAISPLNLMARIAYTRVVAKESANPLFVMFADDEEWSVQVEKRSHVVQA